MLLLLNLFLNHSNWSVTSKDLIPKHTDPSVSPGSSQVLILIKRLALVLAIFTATYGLQTSTKIFFLTFFDADLLVQIQGE